jgi:fatty acyl-CoA reductase
MPNTYTYSKGLAEQICDYYKDQLPIVILRPSIVIGTEREPYPGWCNNFNGPVGLLVACGYGILRTMYASGDEILDCITADIVIKGIIVSSWVRGNNFQVQGETKKLNIFNCSSLHSAKLGYLIEDGKEIVKHLPFKKQLWIADGGVTKWKFLNYLRVSFSNF